MNTQWYTPRWETPKTCYKDCRSTFGIWNDPPVLAGSKPETSEIQLGKGRINLIEDSSIASLSRLFKHWRGKRVACLLDQAICDCKVIAYLVPRYLFQAGILCQRIYPGGSSGFEDENHMPFWPVALKNFDIILWTTLNDNFPPAMRALTARQPLRRFVEEGGNLYLGSAACGYLPYLCDDADIKEAWAGIQHMMLVEAGISGIPVADKAAGVELYDENNKILQPVKIAVSHLHEGYVTQIKYAENIILETYIGYYDKDTAVLEWKVENQGARQRNIFISIKGNLAANNTQPASGRIADNMIIFDLGRRLNRKTFFYLFLSAKAS